jgi:tagatose 6-phosphate kinase
LLLTVTLNPAMDKVYEISGFTTNRVWRPQSVTATAGGKGLNVTRVAHLLGEEVIATGLVGGNNGRFIEDQLNRAGIANRFIRIKNESRTCITITDPQNQTSTEVLEPGPLITGREQANFLRTYQSLVAECSAVTASGSLPAGVPVDFYRELGGIAQRQGKKFILDTSGLALKTAISASASLLYMIKPNQEELEALLGRNLTRLDDQARVLLELKRKGLELPCVTLGKAGCLAVLEEGVFHFSTPSLPIINTVGSGDSFVAGCAAGLIRQLSPIKMITLGIACGMANTQFMETGRIERHMVEEFLEMVTVRKIDITNF